MTRPDSELDLALAAVDRRIREIVEGSDRMVLQYMAELSKGRGKRIRPRLMLSMAELLGGARLASLANCAACIELLHMASLVHDDVIDEAAMRRSNLTLNSLYGNEIAVVVGDYMLALVLQAIIEEEDFNLVRLLLGSSQDLGMGVIQEVLNRNNFRLESAKYFEIIQLKTASLFQLSCSMGAYLAGASADEQALAREYGLQLGLAFQVVDDLLDLTVESSVSGKPAMNDLKEGRITLPVILALQSDATATRELVERYQASHSGADERALKDHLARLGAIRNAHAEGQARLAAAAGLRTRLARDGERSAAAAAELARLEQSVPAVLAPAASKVVG